jgi:hypothetical protein
MPPWLIGALIGAVASTIWLAAMKREAKAIAPKLVPLLREHGAQSAAELAAALGLKGNNAPAKVRMALDALARNGEVVPLAVPPGTSQRDRLKLAKYVVKGGLANQPPPRV